MSIIISIVNIKGGTGKTMTSINIAGEMAEQKHKVLLIDNDSQSNLTDILNVNNEYSLYDLYSNNKITFDDCITEYNANIDVIPNSIKSATLERKLNTKRNAELTLFSKLNTLTKEYDFIIIDNSPFLGIQTINALTMSNYYIEIIDNSTSALQGLNMVNNLISDIISNGYNKELILLGILRNNFQKRTIFGRQFNDVIVDSLQDELFNTIIYNSIKYKEANAMHKTIQEYDSKHSESYKELYYEIINRIK